MSLLMLIPDAHGNIQPDFNEIYTMLRGAIDRHHIRTIELLTGWLEQWVLLMPTAENAETLTLTQPCSPFLARGLQCAYEYGEALTAHETAAAHQPVVLKLVKDIE